MNQFYALLRSRQFSLLVKITGLLIMTLTSIALVVTLTQSWSTVVAYWPSLARHGSTKHLGTQIGKLAEFGVFGSAGFLIVKKAISLLKERLPSLLPLLKELMLFLKRNHTFFGWFILIVAISHGAYFLIYRVREAVFMYTGLAAFAGLLAVSGLGIYIGLANKKKKPSGKYRKWHFVSAVAFVVLFLIHLYS
jgi:hypothetical protein